MSIYMMCAIVMIVIVLMMRHDLHVRQYHVMAHDYHAEHCQIYPMRMIAHHIIHNMVYQTLSHTLLYINHAIRL
jgi:hypothetical protein